MKELIITKIEEPKKISNVYYTQVHYKIVDGERTTTSFELLRGQLDDLAYITNRVVELAKENDMLDADYPSV